MFAKSFWLIMALGLFICKTNAQNGSPDSLRYSTAAEQVVASYNAVIDDQSELYNGMEYQLYPPAYKGSPYFQNNTIFMPAIVRYNGIWYKNVPALYDMYSDVIVSVLKDHLYILRSDKISDVYLSGHHFVYLDNPKIENLTPGFYDQLYNGKTEVLVKRTRKVQSIVTDQTVEVIYENRDVIYIKNGSNYTPINSKASVMDIFKDKAKQLNQYLNNNKISYRKDKEQSIVKLASYYDQLTN